MLPSGASSYRLEAPYSGPSRPYRPRVAVPLAPEWPGRNGIEGKNALDETKVLDVIRHERESVVSGRCSDDAVVDQ